MAYFRTTLASHIWCSVAILGYCCCCFLAMSQAKKNLSTTC